MSATNLLIFLMGAITLMLWGMRMVRTGVERALGARLNRILERWLNRRIVAFLSGTGIAIALQSSTATAILANNLALRSAISTATALAVILGADVGTALAAVVLSLDLSLLAPVFIATGFVVHGLSKDSATRQYGRATIGLGIVLLSLELLRGYTRELTNSEVLPVLIEALAGESVMVVLIFAFVTWLLHSSLAAVLFTASLAAVGIIDTPMMILLVLGANLGGGLPALTATTGLPRVARRIPTGGIIFRAIGVLAMIPFVSRIAELVDSFALPAATLTVLSHVGFSLLLAIVFLPFLGVIARKLDSRWQIDSQLQPDEGAAPLLDDRLTQDIDTALTAAARETVRLGGLMEAMYRDVIDALCSNDRVLAKEIAARDDTVDKLHHEIKLFVTGVSRHEMSQTQSRRATQILTFATDLENIADIVESIAGQARRKSIRGLQFSAEGVADLNKLHERIMHSMHTAFDVFMTGDSDLAKRLIDEKRSIGRSQRALERAHLKRLRDGRAESIETTSFHQDVLRDLKRIHSHLVTVSYAIVDNRDDVRA